MRETIQRDSTQRTASPGRSAPAAVLLKNLEMVSPGGFYRKGSKARERAVADLRQLATAIIAVGCEPTARSQA